MRVAERTGGCGRMNIGESGRMSTVGCGRVRTDEYGRMVLVGVTG
jgi:hypothetical protein